MFVFLVSVAGDSHVLAGFAHTLACALHVYKPTVQPVASHCLFLDIQVATLLLGGFSLCARANLYYPTIRVFSYFSTIFVAHLLYVHLRCKRGAMNFFTKLTF